MFGARAIRAGKIQAPSYTLGIKPHFGSFFNDVAGTPGPAKYSVGRVEIYQYRAPVYSVTMKNYPPVDKGFKIGPGSHDFEKYWGHKPRAPGYSFGIHHSRYTVPLITREDVSFEC